jgi:hypothetical protein
VPDGIDDSQLERLLLGDPSPPATDHVMPDFARVKRELSGRA